MPRIPKRVLETRSATPNFLRGNRLGFHSPHPPPPPHCSLQMGRSKTETSRSVALGRVHSEKWFPPYAPLPIPALRQKKRGEGLLEGTVAPHSPGGHLLRLWTCRSPSLPTWAADGGRRSPPVEIVGLELSHRDPSQRGCHWQKNPLRGCVVMWYATRAEPRDVRRGLTEQDFPHIRKRCGPCFPTLPAPTAWMILIRSERNGLALNSELDTRMRFLIGLETMKE